MLTILDIARSLHQKPAMDELARRLAAGPASFPHSLNPSRDLLLLLDLTEADIAHASFLDQRILTARIRGRWVPFGDIEARIDSLARDDAHYIFHIGHVGSTLISRLLGGIHGVLCLREPLILRSLNEISAKSDHVDSPWNPFRLPARKRVCRQLLARTFYPEQRAIVKATSFVSEIADELITPDARALFLYVSPKSYMTTIFGGENSREELAVLTGPRLARLSRHLSSMPWRLWSLTEGERAALSWITEMLSLQAAADRLPDDTVLWVDFDDFLRSPASLLSTIAAHFGYSLDAPHTARLVEGPIMYRYSKAPEHAYSASLRAEVQARTEREHLASLLEGIGWLDRLERGDEKVTRIMRRFSS